MSDQLTAEQAVSMLIAADQPQEQRPEQAKAEEIAADEAQADAVETAEGDEPDADGEEQEEAEAQPVAAPDKWDAQDKAWFAEQPPEVQSKILEQETKREAVLAKARAKASDEARQEVQSELTRIAAVADDLKRLVPKAVATFQQQWGEPDWKATLDQYGAEATMRMKVEYEEQQGELQRLEQAQQQAQALARQQYIAAETQRLTELAPELAADATKQQELAGYLLKTGAKQDDLDNIPAWAAVLAWKAMKYDGAQAAAKAPKTPAAPAKPVLKPAAAQPQTSSQRTAQQLQNRFAQTASKEDAVALILAKGL
jgi:hypothetical protein